MLLEEIFHNMQAREQKHL